MVITLFPLQLPVYPVTEYEEVTVGLTTMLEFKLPVFHE